MLEKGQLILCCHSLADYVDFPGPLLRGILEWRRNPQARTPRQHTPNATSTSGVIQNTKGS